MMGRPDRCRSVCIEPTNPNKFRLLGSYGLFCGSYAELLVKRWAELTGADLAWD